MNLVLCCAIHLYKFVKRRNKQFLKIMQKPHFVAYDVIFEPIFCFHFII